MNPGNPRHPTLNPSKDRALGPQSVCLCFSNFPCNLSVWPSGVVRNTFSYVKFLDGFSWSASCNHHKTTSAGPATTLALVGEISVETPYSNMGDWVPQEFQAWLLIGWDRHNSMLILGQRATRIICNSVLWNLCL